MSASEAVIPSPVSDRRLLFVTHAEVVIDPAIPVGRWGLSDRGRARHLSFNTHPAAARIAAVYSSAERKALDGAQTLADAHGLAVRVIPGLHENDRSATGYLPQEEFERTADAFFAEPQRSVRGWERAVDAQRRVVEAVTGLLSNPVGTGDVAVVAHGGVGALLLAHLLHEAISRRWDQPGRGGGNFFAVDVATRIVLSRWAPIG